MSIKAIDNKTTQIKGDHDLLKESGILKSFKILEGDGWLAKIEGNFYQIKQKLNKMGWNYR